MAQDVYPNFSLTEFTYLFSMEYNAACSSTNFSKRNFNFMQYTFKKNCQIQAIRTRSKIIHSLHVWQMTCSTYEHKTCKH